MKILSISGESVPAGKGGSPSDTFDRSIVTFEEGKETKTVTVTYVRYFVKVLAEKGIYDQEKEGIPVSKIAGVLYLEKHPNAKEMRHYYNDADAFVALFEGFSAADFKNKYATVALA